MRLFTPLYEIIRFMVGVVSHYLLILLRFIDSRKVFYVKSRNRSHLLGLLNLFCAVVVVFVYLPIVFIGVNRYVEIFLPPTSSL